MPSTYTLISSNVLTSSAASVTFSAIPSTYTDLVVRFSARLDVANVATSTEINTNITGSVYSSTRLRGTGSAAQSNRATAATLWSNDTVNANTSTANTFSSNEIYIPNYTSANYKPISYIAVQEDNNASAYIHCMAHLISSSTAMTSLTIARAGQNFLTGSSFYLYGIKSS